MNPGLPVGARSGKLSAQALYDSKTFTITFIGSFDQVHLLVSSLPRIAPELAPETRKPGLTDRP
jgi:hypothetical protein